MADGLGEMKPSSYLLFEKCNSR